MELIKKICSKVEFDNILNGENVFNQFVSFIDAVGEQNFVYMIKRKDGYSLEWCEGYISYNEDRKWSRDKIENRKKEKFLREPFGDGILYEVDTFSMSDDDIFYPVSDIQLLNEDEMIKKLILVENNSVLNLFLKDA